MKLNGTEGPEDDELWKSKVHSLDDTLKSLRSSAPKSKQKPKPRQTPKQPSRGLLSFLHARDIPPVRPIEPNPQTE